MHARTNVHKKAHTLLTRDGHKALRIASICTGRGNVGPRMLKRYHECAVKLLMIDMVHHLHTYLWMPWARTNGFEKVS